MTACMHDIISYSEFAVLCHETPVTADRGGQISMCFALMPFTTPSVKHQ